MEKNVVKKKGGFMKLRNVDKKTFVKAIDPTAKEDNFAKTFVAKTDMIKGWENCVGCFNTKGDLMGAIVLTVSRQGVANLQLLHTFHKYRGKGVAKKLVTEMLANVVEAEIPYFRVSSEKNAVGFYKKLGFKFWGEQKSGCQLCMFKIGKNGGHIYDKKDKVIYSALYSGRKGGLAVSYKQK
jgi:ribosomal protein S18 acetylase RimI-like enzyme